MVSVPMIVPFSKKSTLLTVAPGLAVADALKVVAVPTVAVDPAVSVTVGSVATAVTETAEESA